MMFDTRKRLRYPLFGFWFNSLQQMFVGMNRNYGRIMLKLEICDVDKTSVIGSKVECHSVNTYKIKKFFERLVF